MEKCDCRVRAHLRLITVSAVLFALLLTVALCYPDATERFPQSGEKISKSSGSYLDYSNADQGYIMVKQNATKKKVKVRVTKGNVSLPEYDLNGQGEYEVLPLQLGSGKYTVRFFIQTSGKQYSNNATFSFTAKLENEIINYLYPNQYIWYTADSLAVKKSNELCAGLTSDKEKVDAIASYITRNVLYDFFFAMTVKSGYLPDVDHTLTTGKGICFDYAALFACMLRVQDIPCKLVIGDAGKVYHAWNSVLINGEWKFYDLTYVSTGAKIIESQYAVERDY